MFRHRTPSAQKETPHHKGQGAKAKHFKSYSNRVRLLMVVASIYGAAMTLLAVLAARWMGV